MFTVYLYVMYKQTGNGRWVTHLGFERGNAVVEAQQRVVGRPWSRMVKNGSTTATNASTINKLYRLITLLGITEEENQEQR